MGRRANGEGTIYEFIQKVKKNNDNLEVCSICKNCNDWSLCNNREHCKNKCEKCKNCKDCLKYCDRYYVYDRFAQQCTTKDGARTLTTYAKKKKDIADKNFDVLTKINNNALVDKSKITLYEIASSIVEDRHNKNITNDNSYISNLSKLNRLDSNNFMHIPAQSVSDKDLHDYLNSMIVYSDSVISKDYGLLNATFIKAVRKKILTLNPFDDKDEFRKPRSKRKTEKVHAFTIDEQKLFLKYIKLNNNKYKFAWLLMLYLGLRPGEVFAIKNNNINFKDAKIHIQTTLTHDDKKKVVMGDTTKTYSGDRYITIDKDAKVILEEIQLQNKNKNGLLFYDTDNYMSVQSSNSAFKRFCQKYNIGTGWNENQYVLRHSYATRKIESGMPAEVLKDLLGHKDIKVTLNTYFDAFAEYKNKYNEKSEKYINNLGLNYSEFTKNELLDIELDKILDIIELSELEQKNKEILYSTLEKMRNKKETSEKKKA